jgi:hypothetical protein
MEIVTGPPAKERSLWSAPGGVKAFQRVETPSEQGEARFERVETSPERGGAAFQ